MTDRHEVDLTSTARRALAEKLPLDVAMGVSEFIVGPLTKNPHRVGKNLDPPLDGVYSARVMREWRVLYVIDDQNRRVLVKAIGHRRTGPDGMVGQDSRPDWPPAPKRYEPSEPPSQQVTAGIGN